MNLFERASRAKLRFAFFKGFISTEDLWDLSLEELNEIAKTLNKELKANEEDFISEVSKEDTKQKLKFDLVLHVINAKKTAKAAAQTAAETQKRKQKLAELIEAKKDEQLMGTSLEELQLELAKL